MSARPFEIHVADTTLDELAWRLDHTRWPISLRTGSWEDGADLGYVRELCTYWRHDFDWRAAEHRLNALPQFLMDVEGLALHYVHLAASGPGRYPLLLLHGWPSSITEYVEVAGRLADSSSGEGFDVVVASLPGFGFGGQPSEPGWGISRMARVMDTLMERLEYPHYGVVGTDWGGAVAGHMAATYPERCRAIWTTPHFARTPPDADEHVVGVIADFRSRQKEELGYAVIQRTRPDSLSLAQNDSPAGLAAWMVEKFRAWSDSDEHVEEAFSKDTLLTNLMFYWAPGSVAGAARIYREASRDAEGLRYPRVEVPTAIGVFPAEPFALPREVVEHRYQVARWTEFDRGGHFPGWEVPDLLADDVRAFFAGLRSRPVGPGERGPAQERAKRDSKVESSSVRERNGE